VRRAFLLRLSAKEHALRCTTGWCSL
jgi:hypothetical protein